MITEAGLTNDWIGADMSNGVVVGAENTERLSLYGGKSDDKGQRRSKSRNRQDHHYFFLDFTVRSTSVWFRFCHEIVGSPGFVRGVTTLDTQLESFRGWTHFSTFDLTVM